MNPRFGMLVGLWLIGLGLDFYGLDRPGILLMGVVAGMFFAGWPSRGRQAPSVRDTWAR